MKKLFAFLVLFLTGSYLGAAGLPENENARIYTKTGGVYSLDGCIYYELDYYDDNGTPYNPKDDVYLGTHLAKSVDC